MALSKGRQLMDALPPGLEEMWLQEIGGPIASLRKPVREKLLADGLIEVNEVHLRDAFGKYSMPVYRFTIRGHLMYCEWAAKQESD